MNVVGVAKEEAVPTSVQGGGTGVPLEAGEHPGGLHRNTVRGSGVPAPHALRGSRGLVARPLSGGTRLP